VSWCLQGLTLAGFLSLPGFFASHARDARDQRIDNYQKVYPEYKNLFKEIVDSLKNISGEWVWIINNCFHKKCKELGRCSETTDYKSATEEKIELNKEEF
jgi:hypothetical protein